MTVARPVIRTRAKDVVQELRLPRERRHRRAPVPSPPSAEPGAPVPLRPRRGPMPLPPALACGPPLPQTGITPSRALLVWQVLALVALLATAGLAALHAAAGDSFTPWASRHTRFLLLGIAAMTVAATIPPTCWRRYAYIVYIGAVGLMAAVEIVTGGPGVHRWLDLGLLRFQPLEPMKIALILALARYCATSQGGALALLPPLAMIALPAAMALEQPDLSGAVLLAAGGLAVLGLAGLGSLWLAALLAGIGLIASLGPDLLHAYQARRLVAFLDPTGDPMGGGWQIMKSWQALAAGGLTGRGETPNASVFYRFMDLPLRQNDFVFSVLTEKRGLIGALALLGVFLLAIMRCIAVGQRSPSRFGKLLAGGIGALLALHVAAHVAVAVGYLPVTGIPLPLISDGGTSTVSVLFGFGLVLSLGLHGRAAARQPMFRRRLRLLACGAGLVLTVLAVRLIQLQMHGAG
jgi:rod shape determining protein RodA